MRRTCILALLTVRSFSALAALNTAVFSWANETGVTKLDEVEKQMQQQLEGQQSRAVLSHEVAARDANARITLQRNRHGEPVFRYWFGESRVDRRTFLTLTCTETRCPQQQAVRQKWLAHVGLLKAGRQKRPETLSPCLLGVEERIQLGEEVFVAREARFPVLLKCPEKVHESLRISVKGWDVFGNRGYLVGGWSGDAPMFETLEQVKLWVHAHLPDAALNPSAI